MNRALLALMVYYWVGIVAGGLSRGQSDWTRFFIGFVVGMTMFPVAYRLSRKGGGA